MLFFVATRGGAVPFSRFHERCARTLDAPLGRLWGSRPHPGNSMVSPGALWSVDDPNLAILPRWSALAPGATATVPFTDEHVAVRFLGGVSNHSAATAAGCADRPGATKPVGVDVDGVWCDLVVRDGATGELRSRFDLVRSRLDRYVDAGLGLMIVLDNVPWAFVNATYTGPCQGFGCQYRPPDDPAAFGAWVGELAAFLRGAYGAEYAATRVRWRLGTEANGPRWGDRGRYFDQYVYLVYYHRRSLAMTTAAVLSRLLRRLTRAHSSSSSTCRFHSLPPPLLVSTHYYYYYYYYYFLLLPGTGTPTASPWRR